MDDWEKFNAKSLPKKIFFCYHLNIEDIANADYMHAKIVCKESETKNLGKYHDLYVQINKLLSADALDIF